MNKNAKTGFKFTIGGLFGKLFKSEQAQRWSRSGGFWS